MQDQTPVSLLLAMFSSTLRKRPFWKHLAPTLGKSSIASFQGKRRYLRSAIAHLNNAESLIASSDLIILVRNDQTQITARVLLLTADDLASGEVERRVQELSEAVRPAHAVDVVALIHEQGPSSHLMHSIMQLQNL